MYRSIDMVLDAEISLALQLLDEALIPEAKSSERRSSEKLQGVAENFNLLKDELTLTQAYLKHVHPNKLLEDERPAWISEVRGLVHDAEDAVEMFLVNAEINEGRSRRSGFFKSIATKRDQTGELIHSICASLRNLEIRYPSLLWNKEREIPEKIGWRWRLPYRTKDEQAVGIEDDEVKRLLRESILDEEKKGVSIAVIEGKVGIGKTTLARQIYNHPDVVARFECRAWVWVSSDQFSLETTMKQLILQLPAFDRQKIWELESEESTKGKPYVQQKFQEMLRKQLQGKTYFIVLDNVWEMEHWKSLKPAFPDEQDKTSRILVTTRNKYIATLDRYTHYGMKLLEQEKSWELFLMKACISEVYGRCPNELKFIGRDIAKACNGLPLTISLVGGLLAGTRSRTVWEQVLYLISKGDENRILTIISELSYQNLSPWLQACFSCLAFFKGDATIPAKTLLNIWVAHGFIQKDDRRREEEIARDYLEELIQRNMLQIVDMSMEDDVKNLYLYSFLRDEVCLRRANEELRLETTVKRAEPRRHRVVCGNLETLSSDWGTGLRSLFLHNNEGGNVDVSSVSHDFWKSCQLLKTLHLDGIKLSTFPDSLRALVRLKYLMIRRHKIHPNSCALDNLEAVKLPNWLDDLKHLEIVDMEGEKVEFPNDVALNMKRLRYFSAYCVRGPISINTWENIETLKYIRQEDWMKCYSRRSWGHNVRKLGLFLDPLNRADEWREVKDSLAKMKTLEHLQLQWNPIISIDPEIVPKFHFLTKLKLRGKLTKCPDATIFPQSLSCLTLAFSDLSEDLMAELSELPKLFYLKLLGNAYKPERMQVLSDSFLRLRVLTLKEMFHLKSIDVQQGGMPHLQKLRIQHCPSLQTMNLPEHVVINYIS